MERPFKRNLFKDSIKEVDDSIKEVDDRTTPTFTHVEHKRETTLRPDITLHSTNQRRDHARTRESFYGDEHVDLDDTSFRAEKQPSSRVRYHLTKCYYILIWRYILMEIPVLL